MTDTQPTFIDFEASSLDLVASYPIEVGICLPSGEVKSWMIKPHVLWKDWSASAQRIHGIERDELVSKGMDLDIVCQKLNQTLTGMVYCDAWTFDCFWLHRLFKSGGMKPSFQLESISALLDQEQRERWQPTREIVIRELGLSVHRAANDAIILHETWKRLTR